ncbi:MAG TPA: polysaccharide biosynthesis tyrosine autokinase [Acidimicrobiales bacterium]|nr:polysaccharide biosynthesis tyrosine autokinase [Acidimicrobiales bacterium]
MSRVETTSRPELADYLRVLRRRKGTVLLTAFLLVTAALVSSWLQTPVYAAKAKVLLQPLSTESLFDANTGERNDPARVVDTQIQVLESEPIQDAVRAELGGAPPVSASGVGQTDVIQLVAESTSPSRAARVANAYARAYVDFRRRQAVETLLAASQEIESKVAALQEQIDDIDRQVDTAPDSQEGAVRQNLGPEKASLLQQQAAFKQRLDQVQVDAALTTGRAQLVARAAIPRTPVRPTPVRTGILALVAGSGLGVGLAFLRERLDDSVRSKDDLERAAEGVPVVGTIPLHPGWKRKEEARLVSMADPRSPASEAYRTLRTSIQFLGVDRPIRSLQVTSPNAQEGKTTTVANLGVTIADAGPRVLIVCCDLRRPRVHEFFGLDNSVGLTSVLVGRTSVSSAVQAVPGHPRLFLVASGPLPPNPAEVLASANTTEVLEALNDEFDLLLVDSPPVLPVTDALVVSRRVDATLLTCLARVTTNKSVERAAELLTRVDAPLVGTILGGASIQRSDGYAYVHYTSEPPWPKAGVPNGQGHGDPAAVTGSWYRPSE